MATNYDVHFLRVLMRDAGVDRAVSMRCLQVIGEQAVKGQAVTAPQVAVQLGLVDLPTAQRLDATAIAELQRAGVDPRGVPSFATPGAAVYPALGASGVTPVPTPTGAAAAPAPPAAPQPAAAAPPSGPQPAGALARPPAPVAPQPAASAPPRPAGPQWFDLAVNGHGLEAYELGGQIGGGPVGDTFLGRRKDDRQEVVLKSFKAQFVKRAELFQKILADLGAWSAVRHPFLAVPLAHGVSNGRHVLVFPKAPGKTVQALLEQGRFEPGQALRVLYDVAQALAAAPRPHGDIRAEKVFFDGQHAYLMDPGLWRASAVAAGLGDYGMTFGHPAYLAPEVLQEDSEAPTAAADVYALGVLGYGMLCGRLPFQGEVVDLLRQHFGSPLPPPPEGVRFSQGIAALLLKMTAKDSAERFADAGAVVAAINRLLGVPAAGAAPAAPPQPAAGEEITADVWQEQQSEALAKAPQKDWDADKIGQARTDVEEWNPDDEEEDDEGGGLLALIQEASHAQAVPASGVRRGGASSARLPALAPEREPDVRSMAAAGAGIAAVILVTVGLGVWSASRPEPEQVRAAEVRRPVGPDPAVLEQAAALRAHEAALAEAAAEFQRRGLEAVKSGRFRDATALADELPDEVRSSAQGEAAVRAVDAAAAEASRERFAVELATIRQLVARGEHEAALRRVETAAGWVFDEGAIKAARAEVNSAQEAAQAPLRELALEAPVNVQLARDKLAKLLGGSVRVFRTGTVVVRYDRPDRSLEEGLAVLSGKPTALESARIPMRGNPPALRIAAADPVLLRFKLPFLEVLDVTIDFVVLEEPDYRASFATLLGIGRRPYTGLGVAWGHTPVELEPDGLRMLDTVPQPEIPAQRSVRVRLAVARPPGDGPHARVRVESSRAELAQRPVRGGQFHASPADLAGYVGLYLEQTDVYVTSLELRGLLDPRILE